MKKIIISPISDENRSGDLHQTQDFVCWEVESGYGEKKVLDQVGQKSPDPDFHH